MANSIVGTRSPNGDVGVSGPIDSGELSMLTMGVLSGFAMSASGGMNVSVGGVAGVQDTAVAKNTAGQSDMLAGGGSSLTFTLPAAPGTSGQSQVHSLVLWKDTTVVSTLNNGLDAVGYQVVSGNSATTGTQQPPNAATIRAAIPNGASAFYAVLGNATLPYGASSSASATLTPSRAAFISGLVPDTPPITPARLSPIFMTAVCSSSAALTAGAATVVPISAESNSGMSIATNAIVVPAGVRFVRVSANGYFQSGSLATIGVTNARKNGVAFAQFINPKSAGAPHSAVEMPLTSKVIPVVAGDRIDMTVQSSAAGYSLSSIVALCYITVEAVG